MIATTRGIADLQARVSARKGPPNTKQVTARAAQATAQLAENTLLTRKPTARACKGAALTVHPAVLTGKGTARGEQTIARLC